MRKLMMAVCTAVLTLSSVHADEATSQQTVNESLITANKFLRSSELDEALSVLNDVLEKDPSNIRALRLRGNVYFAKENYEMAMQDFDAIVDCHPRAARSYFDRGIVNFAMGNDELAMDDIEKAFALNPELAEHIESKPNFGQKIHEMREKAHTARFQVRHKGGVINTKGGGLITKGKK